MSWAIVVWDSDYFLFVARSTNIVGRLKKQESDNNIQGKSKIHTVY